MTIFTKISDRLGDIIFPKRCIGCQTYGTGLCEQCLATLPTAIPAKQSFATALFDYKNPTVKRAIWKFKYGNVRMLAKNFSGRLYDEIIGDLSDHLYTTQKQPFLVLPIPLHSQRLRERGYNQSELIVRELIKQDSNNLFEFLPNAILRIRKTKPQAKSDKRATRINNLHGAFMAIPQMVRGRDVIIIDDVITTGATILEARKALRASGARSVRAYVIAH